MSMRHWSEDGFGFPLFNGKNTEAVYQFISDHDAKVPPMGEFREMIREEKWPDGLFEDILGESASWRLAEIINKLEGTTIFKGYSPCGDTDQEEMLGIEPCFPWTMNSEDLRMTEKRATGYLKKYAGILGVDSEPDYFEAHYFG